MNMESGSDGGRAWGQVRARAGQDRRGRGECNRGGQGDKSANAKDLEKDGECRLDIDSIAHVVGSHRMMRSRKSGTGGAGGGKQQATAWLLPSTQAACGESAWKGGQLKKPGGSPRSRQGGQRRSSGLVRLVRRYLSSSGYYAGTRSWDYGPTGLWAFWDIDSGTLGSQPGTLVSSGV